MEKTESKMIVCGGGCYKWKLFVRPQVVLQPVLQVLRCDCGKPLTHIWEPPKPPPEGTRFSLLEVD